MMGHDDLVAELKRMEDLPKPARWVRFRSRADMLRLLGEPLDKPDTFAWEPPDPGRMAISVLFDPELGPDEFEFDWDNVAANRIRAIQKYRGGDR
jgi:hypothetical protein